MNLTTGKISFINHENNYAIIEFEQNGKKKSVKGIIDEKVQKKLKSEKLLKKIHHFMIGDVVDFTLRISERGDRMTAIQIQFLYNNALDELINKAKKVNKFIGYLKIVDEKYFVKEIDSYLFFSVPFSPWQIKPTDEELNQQVSFSLENLDKKEKIKASLLSNVYIPEFHVAVKSFKAKTSLEAIISNITQHGIYLNLINDKIQAKIPTDKNEKSKYLSSTLKTGDKLQVLITHLSKSRITVSVVE